MRRRALAAVVLLAACVPPPQPAQVAKPPVPFTEVTLDGDDETLAVAVERLLEAQGITVRVYDAPRLTERRGDTTFSYSGVTTRYVITVRSEAVDTCYLGTTTAPLLAYHVAVLDVGAHQRVYLQRGDRGCQPSVLKVFGDWLAQARPHPTTPAPTRT